MTVIKMNTHLQLLNPSRLLLQQRVLLGLEKTPPFSSSAYFISRFHVHLLARSHPPVNPLSWFFRPLHQK